MKPNEALSRLEAELEKAIPYWQERSFDVEHMYKKITQDDPEVEVAFKDLIRAIIENKDTNE